MPSWEALRLVARAQRVAAPPAAIVDAATWLLKLGPERQPALHVPAQLLLLEAVRAPPRRPSPRAHLRLIRRADRATARVALLRVVVAARLAAVWVAQRASRLSTRGRAQTSEPSEQRASQAQGGASQEQRPQGASGRREQGAEATAARSAWWLVRGFEPLCSDLNAAKLFELSRGGAIELTEHAAAPAVMARGG